MAPQMPFVHELRCGPSFTDARAQGYTHGLAVTLARREDLPVYAAHEAHVAAVEEHIKPNVADIVGMAQAVYEAGAAGVSLINTITGMAIDARKRRPRLATTYGGLSGPAIKPVALRMVHQVHAALPDLPICGMGGIYSGEDALEFLMAGASCVQVGTANFAEPPAALRVLAELKVLLASLGFARAEEAVGSLESIPPEPEYRGEGDG